MRKQIHISILLAVLSAATIVNADDKSEADFTQIANSVRSGLVQVRYKLQFDKGQAPNGTGWSYLCPNCSNTHYYDLEETISEEREAERAGFALSPTLIISSDPLLHSRFIKHTSIRFGDQVVDAKPIAFAIDQAAVLLETATPLKNVQPFEFDSQAEGPYSAITYGQQNGDWIVSVRPLSKQLHQRGNGERYFAVPTNCLIVDNDGKPVGMSMISQIPDDDSWKGSPVDWKSLDIANLEQTHASIDSLADYSIPRVSLSFRSPRKSDQSNPYARYGRGYGYEDDSTERNVAGLMLDEQHILILSMLKPKVTARLERIMVHTPDGEAIPATFVGSLKDYGGFVAKLESPVASTSPLSRQDIRSYRKQLLLTSEIAIQGENRVAYYWHDRIRSFSLGWKKHIYPAVSSYPISKFLFDTSGQVVAIPISRRKKVADEDQWGGEQPVMTAAKYLAEVFDDLTAHFDVSNIPLSEEEQNRLAWMGVELQALDRELARANGVSDRTNDGEIGALVTFVYANSPASEAGIEMGDLLLRIQAEGQPKPIELQLQDNYMFAMNMFPWDQLDDMPEAYFDQMPTPWPSAENTLNRKLTDIGFSTGFSIEVWRNGQLLNFDMSVIESPPHYASAARYEAESLGVTVRNMTYEVRRYFQKTADDPGVIVSKLEPGSKASIAGLRPYEVITSVNDIPIMNADDFEKAIADQVELRLSVKRMIRGRIVKIQMESAAADEGE
ncbi:MAG: hypothetical protein IH984_13085 [Planctomycetes bacterium]|nr:hypothetical protein [Planctomycetota bacterium]